MWLLVAHFLASSALDFDDFKLPTGNAGTCYGGNLVPNYLGQQTYYGAQCSASTQVPSTQTRYAYMGYLADPLADEGDLTWKYSALKGVYNVARALSKPSFVGISYIPPTPLNLGSFVAFYLAYEIGSAPALGSSFIITLSTASGSGTCQTDLTTKTGAAGYSGSVVCLASTLGLSPSALATTTGLGWNITQSGDSTIYMRAFGTAAPTRISALTSRLYNDVYGIGMLASGNQVSYALTVLNDATPAATGPVQVNFTCSGLQGVSNLWLQSGNLTAESGWSLNGNGVSWNSPSIPPYGRVDLNWTMQVVTPFLPRPAPDSVSCFATVRTEMFGNLVSNTVVDQVMRNLEMTIVQNKTVSAGNSVTLDFNIYPAVAGGALLFQFSSAIGTLLGQNVGVGQTSVSTTLTVAGSTTPGVYPITATFTPQSGNKNLILDSSITFYVTVNQLPITSVSGVPSLFVTPDVTNSSVFNFTTNQRAINGAIRLTPSSPYFTFTPSSVLIPPGSTLSDNLYIHALEGAPSGVRGFSVLVTGEPGNNNDLTSVGTVSFLTSVTVTQDAITSVSISTITLEAGNAAGTSATFTANIRPVNGTIKLTPMSAWLTFSPASLHFRGSTTAGTVTVVALAGAPKGVNVVQVLVEADQGNNNAIPQSTLTVSGTVTVTQPQITTISQAESLTNVTAGGASVSLTYFLPKIALNGSISVALSGSDLLFSPNPLIIAKDTDRATVVVTAKGSAWAGLSSVTAIMTSMVNNNNDVTPTPVTVIGLQVIQYMISSMRLSSNVVVASGDNINHQITSIEVPVPVVNGTVTITPTATKLTFNPVSVTISAGSNRSATFEVIAAADAPTGQPDITVTISQNVNNNNRLAQSSFVISNAVTVNLIPITAVVVNAESGSTQRNQPGTTTFTLTTLKVVNGSITLTPVAAGITFTPTSLSIAPGSVQTASFTYVASSQAVGGARSITVSLSGASNNNNRNLSPFTVGSLTILDADIPNTISLTPSVAFVAGSTSSQTHFHLGAVASNGSVTITPSFTGLTFSPASVDVDPEATDSAAFTVTVDSTVNLALQPFSVTLTLTRQDGNNNNLLGTYTVDLPVTGLPIATATYNQAETRVYAGFSVANQRVTVDQRALNKPVTLSLSSPFFDFMPSTVTIPAEAVTSDFFTLIAKPNAVPGANSFNVDFSHPPDNNNIIPTSTVIVTGVTVEQKPVTNLWVLDPIDVLIGNGPSAPTHFYLDEPAVNGSIKLTPSHPELIFVPNPVYVHPGSNVSEPFTVTAPENMIAAPFGVAFPVSITGDSGNNNALPDNNPAPSSNNGIYVRKPVFVNIHLNESISVNVGHNWSSSVSLVFDVPMLNDSAVFTLFGPESSGIEFEPPSVTVAHGSTVSSPFKVKFQDFVAARVFPFSVANNGGPYLNNDVIHLSDVPVRGLNATWAAITTGTIPSTTVYAGGNATDSVTITLDEAPVYSDILLDFSGENLVFSPATVKVLKGQLVSEPFTITADGAAHAGAHNFIAVPRNVENGVAHNNWTQLDVALTVGQLRWNTVSYVNTPHVIAGSSLGTTFQVRADKPAINDMILITSQNLDIRFCRLTGNDCQFSPDFAAGSDVSATAKIVVPRSYRPGVYSIDVSFFYFDNVNMVPFGQQEFLPLSGLVVEDGFGPLLNITTIVPEMTFATVTVKSDEAGSVWCKAVLRGASAPSYASGYTDHPADVNFTAAGSSTFNLTDLASNTEYDIYCYGVDVINNKDTAAEVVANKAPFKTTINPDQLNRMGPSTTGLAPASVAGIVIGAIIGVLLMILLAVGIKRWLNSRSDWTKNESLFLEAELAQKKKPAGEAASSAAPSSPAPGASPAPAPAAAVVSTSGKGTEGLPTL